jgi:hypothetical protein
MSTAAAHHLLADMDVDLATRQDPWDQAADDSPMRQRELSSTRMDKRSSLYRMARALTGTDEFSRLRAANQVTSHSRVCALPRVKGMARWMRRIGSVRRSILKCRHALSTRPAVCCDVASQVLREMTSCTRPGSAYRLAVCQNAQTYKEQQAPGDGGADAAVLATPGRLWPRRPPRLAGSPTRTGISNRSAHSHPSRPPAACLSPAV